jgi:hypothetical protein
MEIAIEEEEEENGGGGVAEDVGDLKTGKPPNK